MRERERFQNSKGEENSIQSYFKESVYFITDYSWMIQIIHKH